MNEQTAKCAGGRLATRRSSDGRARCDVHSDRSAVPLSGRTAGPRATPDFERLTMFVLAAYGNDGAKAAAILDTLSDDELSGLASAVESMAWVIGTVKKRRDL